MKTNGEESTHPHSEGNKEFQSGLTKREYFAAMAMQGLCAGCPTLGYASLAQDAVAHADALINELNK